MTTSKTDCGDLDDKDILFLRDRNSSFDSYQSMRRKCRNTWIRVHALASYARARV